MTTLRQAAEGSKSDLWTKERLAKEQVVLCLRGSDVEEGKFGMQWIIRFFAIAGKQRIAQKIWFASTQDKPDMPMTRWDEMFSQVSEWPEHNVLLVFNGYKVDGSPNIQAGYHLEFLERTPAQCPCSQFRTVDAPKPTRAIAAPDHFYETSPATEMSGGADVNEILTGMGFEGEVQPLTDATRHKLLVGASALKAQGGAWVDPGDVDNMSEAQGQQRLLQMRQQWQSGSALQGTDKL